MAAQSTIEPSAAARSNLEGIPLFGGLLAYSAAFHLLGPVNPAADRLLCLIGMCVVIGWILQKINVSSARRTVLLAVALLAILVPQFAHNDGRVVLLSGVAMVLLVAWRIALRSPVERVVAHVARAISGACLVIVFTRYCWPGQLLVEGLSELISMLASVFGRQNLDIGPTFTGVWIWIPFLIASFDMTRAVGWTNARTRFMCECSLQLVVLSCIVAAMTSIVDGMDAVAEYALAIPSPHHPYHPDHAFLLGFINYVFLGSLLLIHTLVWRNSTVTAQSVPPTPSPRWQTVSASGLIALGLVGLLIPGSRSTTISPVVAFHDAGQLDWNVPVTDRFGLLMGGMYGLLPQYLQASGYRVKNLDGQLNSENLAHVNALVMVLPRKPPTESELRTLYQYLERGGSLLVLGDHTDLYGSQAPMNALLSSAGIQVPFDSAFALRPFWIYCQSSLPHAVTVGIRDEVDTRIATGSSLRLNHWRARPLIVGQYGFGDFGNRANGERGGFLGDYKYQRGERLGDLVLGAESSYGAGRIIAFGDTSSFQNIALPDCYPFVERIFQRLTSPPDGWRQRWSLSVLGLGLIILLWMRNGWTWAAGLLLLVDAGQELLPHRSHSIAGRKVAVVSTTNVPCFPLERFRDNSAGAVMMSLMRSGFLPQLARVETPTTDVGLIACIGPLQPYSNAQRERLRRFMHDGGTLLIAASPKNLSAANSLLELGGIRATDSPIGNVRTSVSPEMEIEFLNAVSLDVSKSDATVAAEWNGEVIVAEVKVGQGRLLAFGDADFFLDRNLEGEKTHKPGNLKFLQRLLQTP
ncbi:MAG: hypothetical protein JSS49_29225 [Planctomycetes bacterium]|nr:hypothetical protein [Planctomycetota bacterium]